MGSSYLLIYLSVLDYPMTLYKNTVIASEARQSISTIYCTNEIATEITFPRNDEKKFHVK